ncbi:SUKH-4 family immunity protein [Streptomyces sp. NPDC047315]|uniref:SUKH-4 family immunity protein n=1 Tax=Streptomyces sp. NPDC047315 TaxID=3155142 RepID=UPI0033FC9BC2
MSPLPPVTTDDIVGAFGLAGVVFLPRVLRIPRRAAETTASRPDFSERTSAFLSGVGLPSDYVFIARAGEGPSGDDPGEDKVHLGPWTDDDFDFDLPEACRSWPVLGQFRTAFAAVNPADDRVYEVWFDGDGTPVPIHRDVESLARSLIELQKFCEQREEDEDLAPEELRRRIGVFDDLPFGAAETEWTRMLEEIEDGIF